MLAPFFLPGLTTPGYEIQKIRYKNELLKSKDPAPDV
jgi:hypothetical protein